MKALKRATRTAMQVTLVTAILELLITFNVDITDKQYKAILTLGTILVSYLHNLLEDQEVVPTLLK